MAAVHTWHDVPVGSEAPEVVNAIIEIPRGSTVKYELCTTRPITALSLRRWPRMTIRLTFWHYDVLALCQEPVDPLTLLSARPIGLMTMVDEGKLDHKVIAVVIADPEFVIYQEAEELPRHRLEILKRFFLDYKVLENKEVEVDTFEPAAVARQVIEAARERYDREVKSLPGFSNKPTHQLL